MSPFGILIKSTLVLRFQAFQNHIIIIIALISRMTYLIVVLFSYILHFIVLDFPINLNFLNNSYLYKNKLNNLYLMNISKYHVVPAYVFLLCGFYMIFSHYNYVHFKFSKMDLEEVQEKRLCLKYPKHNSDLLANKTILQLPKLFQ